MGMKMTQAMTSALINTPSKQGAKPTADVGTLLALHNAGLTGPLGGLTRKGSAAADKAKRAAEDAAFGA